MTRKWTPNAARFYSLPHLDPSAVQLTQIKACSSNYSAKCHCKYKKKLTLFGRKIIFELFSAINWEKTKWLRDDDLKWLKHCFHDSFSLFSLIISVFFFFFLRLQTGWEIVSCNTGTNKWSLRDLACQLSCSVPYSLKGSTYLFLKTTIRALHRQFVFIIPPELLACPY